MKRLTDLHLEGDRGATHGMVREMQRRGTLRIKQLRPILRRRLFSHHTREALYLIDGRMHFGGDDVDDRTGRFKPVSFCALRLPKPRGAMRGYAPCIECLNRARNKWHVEWRVP